MEQKEKLQMWLLAALAVVLTDVVLGISQCGIQFVEFEILMVCNQSRSLKEKERCAADGEGLIVGEMITSSLSNVPACEFINSDAMNMTCLRSNSGREREYDEVFAQILDAVSGKHVIEHLPRVNPLPMEKDHVTPFIAFKKSCKPVDPDRGEGAQSVIDICTNRTINYTRVYLVLNSEKHVDVLTEPSVMCHCTLQADSSITLQALDVRLQNSSNNQCNASSLEFKSEEKSIELKCQDRPLFRLETLFEGKEINLTLHTDYAPKMVWIEGKAEIGKSTLNTIMVSCRTELEVKKMDETSDETSNEDGNPLVLIISIVVGCVALIIIVISFIVVIVRCRHRRSGIFSKPKIPATEYSPISQSPTTESEQLRPCQNSSNQEIYAELEDVYDKPQTSPSARSVAFVPPPLPSLPPPPSSPTGEMAPAKAQTSPSSPARSVAFVPPPLPSLPPPPSSPTGEMAPAKAQTSPSSPTWSVSFVPPPLPSLPPPPSSPTEEAAPAKPPRGKPSSFKRPEKEEYDRIDMTMKKREALGRIQNNNVHSEDHIENAEGNVYDHLNSETETSQNPRKHTFDNVYAVPDQK